MVFRLRTIRILLDKEKVNYFILVLSVTTNRMKYDIFFKRKKTLCIGCLIALVIKITPRYCVNIDAVADY